MTSWIGQATNGALSEAHCATRSTRTPHIYFSAKSAQALTAARILFRIRPPSPPARRPSIGAGTPQPGLTTDAHMIRATHQRLIPEPESSDLSARRCWATAQPTDSGILGWAVAQHLRHG